jgi:3-oxoacyl-[acyl-carrier-protein] synthase II
LTHQKNKRIVITGLSVISALGNDLEVFWKNILSGESGISPITKYNTKDFGSLYGGEITSFQPEAFIKRTKLRNYGPAAQFAIAAAKMACQNNISLSAKQTAVCIGVTGGEGKVLYDKFNKILGLKQKENLYKIYPAWNIASAVNKELNLNGPTFTFPMACSAGNYALIRALELIKTGTVDFALAGGSDSFSYTAYAGFIKLRSMAKEKVQPFDKNRTGILIGEGSGILLLEDLESAIQRKAKIYGEIIGYGLNCDGYHLTAPHPQGLGLSQAMKDALKMANLKPENIDYISAHGTGTLTNDQVETKAIKNIFKVAAYKTPVSSIKSMLGHCMGAASAIEAVVCCLALRDNMMPPTINYETADPLCDLDYIPNKARKKDLSIVMSNALAFGGINTSIIIKKSTRKKT